jgi:hypothetical protein
MKALLPEQKADHWKRFDATARRHEEAMSKAARGQFERDYKELAAILTGTKRKSIEDKATLNWQYLTREWNKYMGDSEDLWAQALMPVIRGVMLDQAKELIATVGGSFDLEDIRAASWFSKYVLRFAEKEGTLITETTKDQLSRLLQQAKLEGWSIRDIEKQLGATFDRFLGSEPDLSDEERAWFTERNVPNRLEVIARTESIRSANGAQQGLYKEWGVPKKEWVATLDPPRARENHMEMNGTVVDADEPFDVQGVKMMFPGDPDAPIGETANCRCTTVPVGMDEM